MELPIVQIDAFTDRLFAGNPAAVMPLPRWLPEDVLQAIAAENNLSETAFYTTELPAGVIAEEVPSFHLRWFTPVTEVDLCGHATLATSAQIFEDLHQDATEIAFWTRSGWLRVERDVNGSGYTMNFPAGTLAPPTNQTLAKTAASALGVSYSEAYVDMDLVLVVDSADVVAKVVPDFTVLGGLPVRGVVLTAPGEPDGPDFVLRVFGSMAGAFEDPVTGSACSQIAPYWAQRLGRDDLVAHQLSKRGGVVTCVVAGDRVRLTGQTRRYLNGTVQI